jgi:hypothetical protein
MLGGAAAMVLGVVLIVAAPPVFVVGVAADATGVGIPVGVTINAGAAAMFGGGLALIGGGFVTYDRGVSGLIVHMARKRDLAQVDGIARKHGIRDRRAFGRWLEDEKTAEPGTANERGDYTKDELDDKAEEYKEEGGR